MWQCLGLQQSHDLSCLDHFSLSTVVFFSINRIKNPSYIKVKTKKAQSQIAHQVFLCSATFSVFVFLQGSGAYKEALLLALCDGLFCANLKISYGNIIVDRIRYFSLDSRTHYLWCFVYQK